MARNRSNSEGLELLTIIVFLGCIALYLYTESVELALIILIASYTLIYMAALRKGRKERERLRRSGIHEIDRMDGFLFEEYLSLLFRSLGYKAKVTSASGDFGADLILHKDGETIVAQAKRYKKNVGIKAVQEVSASKKHYNANKAIVVTNSYYTKSAIELAKSNNVQLIDRDQLIDLILKAND